MCRYKIIRCIANAAMSSILLLLIASCTSKPDKPVQEKKGPAITFAEHHDDKRVDVMVEGKPFTTYRWPDNIYKPILYPLLTSQSTEVTRGFPIKPREGERNDHIHQVGNWLNYGNVNGFDFWGNGSTGQRDLKGGQIKHHSVDQLSSGSGEGSMLTTASWIDPMGKELLAEKTTFHFIAKDSLRIIDRITTLTANSATPVIFKDTKEGMFGIRVARQLELPSDQEIALTDAQGNPTTVKKISSEKVTGNYRSSEGVLGEAVWSTRAKWMDLFGSIKDEKISLVICDHPDNISYPTYWHARGYGLFAANPFGAKDFTKEKEELNYTIPPGQSITFKYRILIYSGKHLSDAEINGYADDFGGRY